MAHGESGKVGLVHEFRRRFWLPPRPHGDAIEDRTVSFLELFYDLVYVVVIARAAHTLAEHITWEGILDFAVIFGLIWLAWMNGTLYYEIHGREEGRTRFYVFAQMLLLALLAVFTSDAATTSGRPFAITYTLYLLLLTWLWYTVRRQDSDEYMGITAIYLWGMVTTMVVVLISAYVPDDTRIAMWGILGLAWIVFAMLIFGSPRLPHGTQVTGSLVERFGLFVIIVLGEVVAGVVNGLADTERTVTSVATGLLGLMIGFAFWWTYFDFVGRRLPIDHPRPRALWMQTHLPITGAIAAAGAAMVGLVEHAADSRTPTTTAWLLTGAVSLGLIGMVVTLRTLRDFSRLPTVFRPTSVAMVVAALVVLGLGWLRPTPWVLALAVVLVLGGVWLFAVTRWLSLDDPDTIVPQGG